VQANAYDLLVLDISMPSTDLFTLTKIIITLEPNQKILILTMSSEQIFAKKYLQLGVKGFINKEATPSEISQAITSILNNSRYLSSGIRDTLMLEMLDSEIAHILSIHISTVSTHKANIMQKLGVSNVIELSKLAQTF
jgi:DNA-binding NarL/FixJ family response regulator